MAGGRPRTTTPEHDELIELGKDLVKWATEPTDELRCRYSEWYSLKHGLNHKAWDLMLQKPEFRGYYEQAQTALGKRWIDGTINNSIAQRFLRLYFPELKQEEDETKRFESSLRRDEAKEVNQELIKSNENFNTYVNEQRDKAIAMAKAKLESK